MILKDTLKYYYKELINQWSFENNGWKNMLFHFKILIF
ncbi:MAG: hypothetical protein RI883_2066 [Bacteroidota bacterium]|jgi:hypothetical protein